MACIGNMMMADKELNELQNQFMKMDKDNDGFLSIEELKDGVKSALGDVFLSQDYYDQMLLAIDTNQDGKIDLTEFLTAAQNRARALSVSKL